VKTDVVLTEDIAEGKKVNDEKESRRTESWGTPEVTGEGWDEKDLS